MKKQRLLSWAISNALRSDRRGRAIATLTKYAPLDQTGVFESHEAIVKSELAKQDPRYRSNNIKEDNTPDFEFLDKHLQHMRELRPDSSVIELAKKRYQIEVNFHYREGQRKQEKLAKRSNTW